MGDEHFLLAGAQRAGTTFLYHLLDQHPEVAMARPLRPEPKFFLREDVSSSCRRDYRALFPRKHGAHVLGEKSTSYMERPDIWERVLSVMPAPKVVFLLRDPVDRAISNYRFSVENGVEHDTLEVALLDEQRREEDYDRSRFSVCPFAYVRRGHYHRFLEAWVSAIGRERIHLVVFERLIADASVAQDLFRWLGVAPLRSIGRVVRRPNESRIETVVTREMRRYLAGQFAESNRILQARYGVDVSLWQTPTKVGP